MIPRRALRMAAVVAALTAGAATAHAQSPIKLGIAGGVALPVSDLANGYEAGYNGTVTLALNAPLFPLGLRVDGMFNRLSGKDADGLGSTISAPDLDISSVNANLTFNLLPLPLARVYLIGGAGYYRTEFRDTDAPAEGKLGYNGGVGVRLGTGGTQLFVEGRYHRVNEHNPFNGADHIDFVPITIGFLF